MTVEQSVSGVILSLERTPIAPASTAANTLSSSHRELKAITGTHKGAGVMSPEVLGILLCGLSRVSREVLEPRGLLPLQAHDAGATGPGSDRPRARNA